MTKTLVVNNATIKFNIWDTAGQEKVCERKTNVFSTLCYKIVLDSNFRITLLDKAKHEIWFNRQNPF